MERFKHIAVLYAGRPGERGTLLRATAIAENNRSRISAVAAVEPIAGVAQILLGKERVEQLESARQQALQAALDADLQVLARKHLRLRFLHGTPAIETIRFILREDCDLLLKMRDQPEKGHAISSTDKKLLRKCPVPVLLLKQSRKKTFARVLAAIDPDPSQPERLDLHRNVLRLATSIAVRERAALDIVHAWDVFSAATLQGPRFKLKAEELNEIIAKELQLRSAWLEELLAPYAGLDLRMRRHLVQGDPSRVIIDLVNRRKSDLLVMGTVARGGLPGLLSGNTAQAVLDSVGGATLTIKPADFVCPITP